MSRREYARTPALQSRTPCSHAARGLVSPESSFASHVPLRQICFQNYNDKVCLQMRSLNLDQLRTLTEVVTCGSFSAAARRLNLTQPAVSLQISELQARIGVRLVERFAKPAHATEPGRKLVQATQPRGLQRHR